VSSFRRIKIKDVPTANRLTPSPSSNWGAEHGVSVKPRIIAKTRHGAGN
jgi:hypothetical protein